MVQIGVMCCAMVGNDNEAGSTIATPEKVNFADCPDLRLANLNLMDWVSASYKPMLHSPDYCTSEPLGVCNSLQCTKPERATQSSIVCQAKNSPVHCQITVIRVMRVCS